MSYLYAMSDMHGCLKPLEEKLKFVDLTDKNSKLIFCGDYIDYGPESCKVIYKVKELADNYPEQVIALRGNHEQMFLDFLNCSEKDVWNFEWLSSDHEFKTIKSFLSRAIFNQMIDIRTTVKDAYSVFMIIGKLVKDEIRENHFELINWMQSLPYHYETDKQIFVHAGIDEEAEDFWKHGTADEYFTSKYPATFGSFYKDIIAGHIGTHSLKGDADFHDIFFDGFSHYYLDGSTAVSGVLPLLKYCTETGEYCQVKDGQLLTLVKKRKGV